MRADPSYRDGFRYQYDDAIHRDCHFSGRTWSGTRCSNTNGPRFQYGGYWVQIIDPWPEYWANDWFYTDPCYIEYWSDGYYLFNPRYPGVTIAVEIFG